jgi:hypothetical protein
LGLQQVGSDFSRPCLLGDREADGSDDHQLGAELEKIAARNTGTAKLFANGCGLVVFIPDHLERSPIRKCRANERSNFPVRC